jgi:hypothetical protein
MRRLRLVGVFTATVLAGRMLVVAQGGDAFPASFDHASIQYTTRATSDAVATLNKKMQAGQVTLAFDNQFGYLKSALSALEVPTDSQVLVYSPTSRQTEIITPSNPRALYFNDTTAVGWVKGGDAVEVATEDPEQGVIFWTLPQKPQERPQFVRATTQCLGCHLGPSTAGVPGMFAMSMLPLSDNQNEYAQGWAVDHRTPIEDRWGGWYVTGAQVPAKHLGNVIVYHAPRSYVRADVAPVLPTVGGKIAASSYLSLYSDVVALLVLNHQTQMTDLITRLGWEARLAAANAKAPQNDAAPARVRDVADELVDYMFFVDEAPLPSAVKGSSGFAEAFSRKGPQDSKGRSLRDLALDHRLLRYPCSYLIYTEAFDALPRNALDAVYRRMWEILSGKDQHERYARLSAADRTAILEILRDTKRGLPSYFQPLAPQP